MKVAKPIDVEFSTRDSALEPVRGAAVSSLSISASRIDRFGWHENGTLGHRAEGPQVGAIVVWPHHVGKIEAVAAHTGMESWVYSAVQHVETLSHDFPTNWPM
jgi:hypothetical protein